MLMRRQSAGKLVVIVAVAIFLVLTVSRHSSAQSYEQQYYLQDGHSTYLLTLSVTPSLYEYYQQKSHQLTLHNFAAFVTPYSMAQVAADIRGAFLHGEDFVNAVLMLAHQIPYEVIDEGRYPVETIFENEGDCDLLSYVTASLTKSEGLDTVLFYYESENHMNIGVNLPSSPENARTAVTYVDYEGTRYYMAECTGADWRNGWRVGECPPELEDAQITVVTLESCEQVAPGQVSSTFGVMKSSLMSLTVSSGFVIEGNTVVVSGQVAVSDPEGTVTLYAATGEDWFVISKVDLSSDGLYVFPWNPTAWGQHRLKASWSGDEEHAGTDSEVALVYVIPRFLVLAGGGLIVILVVAIVLLLIYRTTHYHGVQTFEEPPPPPMQSARASRGFRTLGKHTSTCSVDENIFWN
jgi:hypothetical protein